MMGTRLSIRTMCVATALGLTALLPPMTSAQAPVEKFTGFAINLNSGPRTATVDFTIERWSTDEQRTELLGLVTTEKDAYQSNQRLLKSLQKMPKTGYIRTQNTLAWDLKYARQSPLEEGGRRIVLATDRPIGFREAVAQPRSMDYPFTIVEIHLDANDKGTGKILAGTRIFIGKDGNLVLENWGQQPVRFNEIHKLK
jgi:hypothetical protein